MSKDSGQKRTDMSLIMVNIPCSPHYTRAHSPYGGFAGFLYWCSFRQEGADAGIVQAPGLHACCPDPLCRWHRMTASLVLGLIGRGSPLRGSPGAHPQLS